MIRYTNSETGDSFEIAHPLHGYETDPKWESEEFDPDSVADSADDPFGDFTVADLDRVITVTDMPVDLKLKKADKAVAILVALVGASKADD